MNNCKQCQKEFEPRYSDKQHTNEFCSKKCVGKYLGDHRPATYDLVCQFCDTIFEGGSGKVRYCSISCHEQMAALRNEY